MWGRLTSPSPPVVHFLRLHCTGMQSPAQASHVPWTGTQPGPKGRQIPRPEGYAGLSTASRQLSNLSLELAQHRDVLLEGKHTMSSAGQAVGTLVSTGPSCVGRLYARRRRTVVSTVSGKPDACMGTIEGHVICARGLRHATWYRCVTRRSSASSPSPSACVVAV